MPVSKGKKETPDVSSAEEQSEVETNEEPEIASEDDGEVGGEQLSREASSDTELESRYAQLSDQYVRLVADFDNFRRRTRENETAVREQAAADLVKDLL